eukprot:14749514-Alexandrium_andersonii.AAC.1
MPDLGRRLVLGLLDRDLRGALLLPSAGVEGDAPGRGMSPGPGLLGLRAAARGALMSRASVSSLRV